jgi:folate-dependent tRNA-U54 methylase TrmFO/GidA
MIKINELSASRSMLQNLTEEEASSITGGIGRIDSATEGSIGNSGASNDAVNRASAIDAETAAIGAMASNNASASQSWRTLKAASSQVKGAAGG